MSHVVTKVDKVIIESTEDVTIKVEIANTKIISIEFDQHDRAGYIAVPHDGSMMALFTLKDQLDTVIEEAKKYVRLVGPDD